MADPHLVTFLAERDQPCPACTYNLRGLKTDRCPECNEPLQLCVTLAEPKLALWLTSLIALSVGGGFCFIVGCWGLSRDAGDDVIPLVLGTAASATGVTLLLLRRRHFTQLEQWSRALLTALAFLVPSCFIIWFFITV